MEVYVLGSIPTLESQIASYKSRIAVGQTQCGCINETVVRGGLL